MTEMLPARKMILSLLLIVACDYHGAYGQEVFFHGFSPMMENFQPPTEVSQKIKTVTPTFGADGLGDHRSRIESFYYREVKKNFAFLEYIEPTPLNAVAETKDWQLRPHLRIFGSGLEKEHRGVSIEFQLRVLPKGVKPMLTGDGLNSYTVKFVIGASKDEIHRLVADAISTVVREAAMGWRTPDDASLQYRAK